MVHADPEVRKLRDRERFARRTRERREAGLCPTCGKRPPAPERSVCDPCADRRNRTSRARDARLREAGLPRRDARRAREYERERARREAEVRREAGMCVQCGTAPAAAGRTSCEPCLEKKREADRLRYHRAKDAGLKYGGKSVAVKREAARARSRKRQAARLEANACTRCGQRPPADGGTTCEPCRIARREADRKIYHDRRAARLCVKCGGPTNDGGTRCAPCSVAGGERDLGKKNASARLRYRFRRERGLCTSCGAPSQGAARCPPCAERSYHGSAHFRGIPIWDPTWTVIELATGREHGPFDSEADVALCLAFEKLDRNRVEVLCDASPMASCTSWL